MEIAELAMEVFFIGAAASAMAAGVFAVLYAVSRRQTGNRENSPEDMSGTVWTGEGGTQDLASPVSSGKKRKYNGLLRSLVCILGLMFLLQGMSVPCAANGQMADETAASDSEKISLYFDEDTEPLCITEGVAGYDRTVWAVFSYRGEKTLDQIKDGLRIRVTDREGNEVQNAYHLGSWKEDTDGKNDAVSCFSVRICFWKDAVYTVRYFDTEKVSPPSGTDEDAQGTEIDTGNPGLPLIFVIDRENPRKALNDLPGESGSSEETVSSASPENITENAQAAEEDWKNDGDIAERKENGISWTFTMHSGTAAMNRHYVTEASDVKVTVGNALPFDLESVRLYRNTREIPLEEDADYFCVSEDSSEDLNEKTITVPAENFAQDGVYRLVFTCRDTDGSEFSSGEKAENTLNFGVDSTPPAVEIQDLEENAVYDGRTKNITVLAEDNLKLTSLEIYLDDQHTPAAAWDEKALEETEKQGKSCSVQVEGDGEPKAHALRVTAEDEAGNETEKEVETFYVRKRFWYYLLNPGALAVAAAVSVMILMLIHLRRKWKKNGEKSDRVNQNRE